MLFKRIDPKPTLEKFIECFWIVESDEPPSVQKIIPDGFPEIVIHYADPYKININGQWENQEMQLLAGQITKHFYLQNTGTAGMLGIKFKPHAVTHLFDIDMKLMVDKVAPLPEKLQPPLSEIISAVKNKAGYETLISICESSFSHIIENCAETKGGIELALQLVFQRNGMVTVQELCDHCHRGERQLERLFSKYVGLSPKFFARIIRFSYIFQVMQEKTPSWSDVVHKAGFYDQSHFIKNFKAFTGEDPSSYLFDDPTFANFFMNKSTTT